jgi:predicted nucleotidyltransferase
MVVNLDRNDILSYLRENKDFLQKQFGVSKMALFGSHARNEANTESDIDLIIETNKKSFKNRFLSKRHLEEHFQKKVDICYF